MPQVYRAIRPMFKRNQWRIFPDDIVQVVTGAEAGATGKVLAVIKDKKQPEVIVEGVNMRKKKVITGFKSTDFFAVTMEAPLHYSNVMLLDPVSKKPVSTVLRYLPDGTQVRVGLGPNSSQQVIPIPKPPEDTSKFGLCGAKVTTEEEARRVTYNPSAPFPFKVPKRSSGLPMPSETEAGSRGSGSRAARTQRSAEAWKDPWAAPAWMAMPRLSSAKPPKKALPSTSRSYSIALTGFELGIKQ